MSKTEYHQLVKEWERRRNRLLYFAVCLLVLGFVVAALIANFVPFLTDNPLFFGVAVALLALSPCYLAGKSDCKHPLKLPPPTFAPPSVLSRLLARL
jgi:uncharacterized membrane protein